MIQPTATEINKHLETKLKRVVVHLPGPQKLRVISARVGKKRDGITPLEVQVMDGKAIVTADGSLSSRIPASTYSKPGGIIR